MQGGRAQRVPRSRVAPFLLRVSLFTGVCAAALLGGSAVASADKSDSGPPEHAAVSVERPGSESSPGRSGDSPGKPSQAPAELAAPVRVEPSTPEPVEPAEPAEPEPAKPSKPAEAEQAEPSEPEVQHSHSSASAAGQHSTSDEQKSSGKESGKQENPAAHNGKGAKKPSHKLVPDTAQPLPQAPVSGVAELPETSEPSGWAAHTEAEPRAPDAEPQQVPPQPLGGTDPPVPTPPAPPAPTVSAVSGGSFNNGLRSVHGILPDSPSPVTSSAGGLVAQRDMHPHVDTRSTEPAASPD